MSKLYSFRPLRYDDAETLAAIHKAAFPGFFLSELGESFLTEFYRGYSSDPSAVTCVASNEAGTVVGSVVGTVEPSGFYSRLLLRRAMGFGLAAFRHILRTPRAAPRLLRALTYRGDTPPGHPGSALLASISVDPGVQSSGLGSELVQEWTEHARERGALTAYLTTDRDNNERVNSFYQKLGWTLDGSYSTREGRRMNRYVRSLSPDASG